MTPPEPPSSRASGWIEGASARLRVETLGAKGLPIVFVHSLAGAHRQWKPQLAHFARSRRVLALDLGGHGESEAPADGRYTLERGKDDVVQVMDVLDIPRAILVGHSFGGGVLALLAAERPERAAGLFLLDPIGDGVTVRAEVQEWVASITRADPRRGLREHWTAILEGARPETRLHVLADFEATSTSVVLSALVSIASFDAGAVLRAYAGPRLCLITPANDFPSSLPRVDPTLPTLRVEGTSHWPQLDRPARVSRALQEFTDSIC